MATEIRAALGAVKVIFGPYQADLVAKTHVLKALRGDERTRHIILVPDGREGTEAGLN